MDPQLSTLIEAAQNQSEFGGKIFPHLLFFFHDLPK